jgi:histone H3/H4
MCCRNNLPASQVKSLVESMTNSRISSATLNSFLFATDKYFEQVSGDLLAYSKHAQRKVVNEDDVLCLFKRFCFIHSIIMTL